MSCFALPLTGLLLLTQTNRCFCLNRTNRGRAWLMPSLEDRMQHIRGQDPCAVHVNFFLLAAETWFRSPEPRDQTVDTLITSLSHLCTAQSDMHRQTHCPLCSLPLCAECLVWPSPWGLSPSYTHAHMPQPHIRLSHLISPMADQKQSAVNHLHTPLQSGLCPWISKTVILFLRVHIAFCFRLSFHSPSASSALSHQSQ